jgi:uncharacterized protein (TIGR03118 family)
MTNEILKAIGSRHQKTYHSFGSAGARRHALLSLFIAASAALSSLGSFAQTSSYVQTNIVSDGSVPAMKTDTNLLNPWGVAIGKAFWIDSPGSGLSLIDDAQGNQQFTVAVPPAVSTSPHGQPTGVVFNGDTTNFKIPGNGQAAQFVFATLDGTVAAWNSALTAAVTVVNNSAAKAAYTGIAIDVNTTGSFLLLANQASGAIDIFNNSFAPAQLSGNFSDPTLPANFHAFSVHIINNQVYVGYTQVDPTTGKRVTGAGLGFVNVFDLNGNFVKRAISQGNLNAPWGIVLAPAGFGSYGGDLLVGNFGDGVINVFDPNSFALLGQLQDAKGNVLVNSGLWDMVFGAKNVGDPNTLFFAAGVNGTKGGLFGSIAVVVPPAGNPDFTLQSTTTALTVQNGQSGNLNISLTGSNGFNGAVALSCSGLPSGDSCSFNPASINLSGTSATTVAVTIATAKTTASAYAMGMTLAFISPLGLFVLVGLRHRPTYLRAALFVAALTVIPFGILGCSSSSNHDQSNPAPSTPVTTQIMVNATAGNISHSIPVALTVN